MTLKAKSIIIFDIFGVSLAGNGPPSHKFGAHSSKQDKGWLRSIGCYEQHLHVHVLVCYYPTWKLHFSKIWEHENDVFLLTWEHQSSKCPFVRLSPLTSTSKPAPFSHERFQMGINISSQHACVYPHGPMPRTEGFFFLLLLFSWVRRCTDHRGVLVRDHSTSRKRQR